MAKVIDITGQKFGKLRVIERAGHMYNSTAWLCKCDCGNTTMARTYELRKGLRKSCGCGSKRKCKDKESAKRGKESGQKCYNVFCDLRNNIPRGGVWSCTNRRGCPDCQRVRSSEKGERHDK